MVGARRLIGIVAIFTAGFLVGAVLLAAGAVELSELERLRAYADSMKEDRDVKEARLSDCRGLLIKTAGEAEALRALLQQAVAPKTPGAPTVVPNNEGGSR